MVARPFRSSGAKPSDCRSSL